MIAQHRSQFAFFFAFFMALATPTSAVAQDLFFDDFEDRVADQPLIGNDWTWFDMTYGGDECTGERTAEFGPFSDGDGSDFPAENRNYFTASEDVGQGDSYYRAGLEVPAWPTTDGGGALTNMLRVYGNQFNEATTCQRTLIFKQMDITEAGPHVFSFEVTQDQFGAPANGETTFAFVKVLRQSDESFEEIVFETVETTLTDTRARLFQQKIDFVLTEDHVGELLQFGFYNDVTPDLGHSWTTSGAYYDNVRLATVGIGPGHSGTFFNTGQAGHGFSIEFGESNGAPVGVVYWYTWDDEGNNVFLTGVGFPDGDRLEVDFTAQVGMVYGDFDPDTVDYQDGGSGVFTFTSRDSATFSYSPSDFTMGTFGHMTPVDDLELVKLFPIPADDEFTGAE